ncbi:MAG TPA: ATP-binding protein [Rhodanobacteraceae bacterium]|nr:ATP-binding protein [Rhodanobacteraceae bacterium]
MSHVQSGSPVPDLLRVVFDVVPDALLAVDSDGMIVFANAHTEELFGYTPGAMLRMPLETVLPSPLRHAPVADFRSFTAIPRVRAAGLNYQLRGVRRDGKTFAAEVGLSPLGMEQGALAIVSIRETSGSRRARRDTLVVQIGRLLLESSDYRQAISQVPEMVGSALDVDAVAIFSSEWHRGNLHARAVHGISMEASERLAASFTDANLVHHFFVSRDLPALTLGSAAADEFGPVRTTLLELGFRDAALAPLFGLHEPSGLLAALSRTGRRFDHATVSFLQSVANLLASAVQRGRIELQLAHAQRLDAVGQLTGGIAHDFNNLLTVVSGNLQLLEMELGERPDAHEAIAGVQRAVARGAELTRKLLAFSRRQPLRPVATPPKPMLDELGVMLRRTLGGAIAVEIDCPVDIPDAYADPNELETALINLALNGRDAMPRGGCLTLAARMQMVEGDPELSAGRYVVFAVADTGTGMSPEVQARVFEPFFTTKDSGKGSGLGMSMVYGFVTQSGGRMTVDSRLGYGTRIELWLPAPGAASLDAPATRPPTADAGQATTVLVVEDEPEVLAIATAFLRSLGHAVLTASNAQDALGLLADHAEVGLLFSDVVLGNGMNGVALAREALRVRPGLRVLLTSGYPHSSLGQPGDISGFELLRKPYRREELADAVARVLAGA